RTGRGRSLTTEAVAEAALAEGLAAFSMPAVAARLGVSHSTLYRYVRNRDDLVRTAIGLVVERSGWPDERLPWRALLGGFADALWLLCDTYPGLAPAVLSTPGTPPAIVGRLARYGAALVRDGLTPREAVVTVDFVADLALTSWTAMRDLDRTTESGRTVREEHRASLVIESPLGAELAAEETWHGRGWFDDKLAVYLDGLAGRLAARGRG
ncbi:TetR/AcrR family transcriptional regulator, partial [Kitasatospora sp. NPDC001574]